MRASDAKPPDGAAALRWSLRGCELGNLTSCNNLGVCYQRGTGVPKDLRRAGMEYAKACQAGLGLACFNVGELADELPEIDQDTAQGAFERACELGYGRACPRAIYPGMDPKRGLELTKRGCELGVDLSCAGKALFSALSGNPREAREAVAQLTKSCATNDAVSCLNLAIPYAAGAGVPRDMAHAQELIGRACNLGNQGACKLKDDPSRMQRFAELGTPKPPAPAPSPAESSSAAVGSEVVPQQH